jgi:hypothetical protein
MLKQKILIGNKKQFDVNIVSTPEIGKLVNNSLYTEKRVAATF